ncbi:DUF4232 domain-containing protein [Streptomyces sp. TRM S81-3]|uniref:DUF4232 domain-containing protein n=1 Tax=Streptomyces griseicoloratus TaxID=2752516 RepID=A0A926QPK1_9ACTN|nr:DUF4232 domain-containing protein [Streptomyces griseicoloratus]MBD0418811.1 DUF4232 domain-containing protein [Streptomyces griseicoloratus]
MRRYLILPAALACCAVLTGCSGQGTENSAGDDPSAVTAPSTGESSGSPADSGTTGPSGRPTPASSPVAGSATATATASDAQGRCHTSELSASVGANRPGAGQSNFALVLTNGSRRTCTVYGFPGVEFVNGAGEAVTPDPERATDEERRTVTLAPGASAWSALTYTNPALTGVTTVTPAALRVTPPDETAALSVRWAGGEVSNTGKASVPRLSPLRPGDGT